MKVRRKVFLYPLSFHRAYPSDLLVLIILLIRIIRGAATHPNHPAEGIILIILLIRIIRGAATHPNHPAEGIILIILFIQIIPFFVCAFASLREFLSFLWTSRKRPRLPNSLNDNLNRLFRQWNNCIHPNHPLVPFTFQL
jgi:hypothetical protein